MTADTDAEALRFTKKQVFYLQTALPLLAQRYEEQDQGEHASESRMLATRIAAHESEKRDPTPDEMFAWQQRFAECMADPEKLQLVTQEWFHHLLEMSPDPVRMFLSAFMPVLNQARLTTALEIIFTLHAKLNDMSDRNFDADTALNEVIKYLDHGQQQIERGEPLWQDDPDLPGILEKLRQKLMQQQQAVPTPPVA